MFFGGGVLMRVGRWSFNLGNPANSEQIIVNHYSDLESKAKISDEATQQFYQYLNQGNCQKIYDQSTELFQSSVSESVWTNTCSQIKIQNGTVEDSEQFDWWGHPAKEGGSYILSQRNTKFSESTVQEDFVWLVEGGESKLLSYRTGAVTVEE